MNERWRPIAICALLSVGMHVAVARALRNLEPQSRTANRTVEIRVVQPPPPEPPVEPQAEPAKTPELPKPEPVKPTKTVATHAKPSAQPPHDVVPTPAAPSDHPPLAAPGASDAPTFGVSMDSTSQGGNGPAMQVGNTAQAQTNPSAPTSKKGGDSLGAPVAAYEVTKMPMPQGRCFGKYTDEARQAGIEGTVVLDLIVGDDGRPRDIKIVEGLGHGLSAAALDALTHCQFSPGEKDGKPVAVRVRSFKIRFVLQDTE